MGKNTFSSTLEVNQHKILFLSPWKRQNVMKKKREKKMGKIDMNIICFYRFHINDLCTKLPFLCILLTQVSMNKNILCDIYMCYNCNHIYIYRKERIWTCVKKYNKNHLMKKKKHVKHISRSRISLITKPAVYTRNKFR